MTRDQDQAPAPSDSKGRPAAPGWFRAHNAGEPSRLYVRGEAPFLAVCGERRLFWFFTERLMEVNPTLGKWGPGPASSSQRLILSKKSLFRKGLARPLHVTTAATVPLSPGPAVSAPAHQCPVPPLLFFQGLSQRFLFFFHSCL